METEAKGIIISITIAIILGVVFGMAIESSPAVQERIKLRTDCESACLDEGYIDSGIINDRCVCDLTQKVMVIK